MTDSALVRFKHGNSSAAQVGDSARENAMPDYWQTILAGAPHEVELPADRSRPAVPSKRAAVVVTTLPSAVAARIVAIGDQRDCPTFVTLLAAFFGLLQRSTGQTDLLVGIPVTRHVCPEREPPPHSSTQALLVRIQTTADATFPSLLSNVHAAIVGMLAHADESFELIVRQERAGREDAPYPLVNVAFDFDSTPETVSTPDGNRPDVDIDAGMSGLDLNVALRTELDGSLTCVFAYSTDLFDRTTIDVLAEHFSVLLESITDDANATLGELAMASAAELDMILSVWGRPHAVPAIAPPGHGSRTVSEFVAFNAAHSPDATALIEDDGACVTYSDLDRRANCLAYALRARGVVRDVRVGLYLERSASAVIAMLATLKAGGAYVPLDPKYPPERTAYMLASVNVGTIVTQRKWYAALEAYTPLLCDIDDPAHGLNPAQQPPLVDIDPDSLAYVMFTSGSTGKPNAAAITHRSLLACVTRTPTLACTPDDSVLLHATLTFDASMLMIWPPLVYGARIAIMPATPFSLADFAAQLRSTK